MFMGLTQSGPSFHGVTSPQHANKLPRQFNPKDLSMKAASLENGLLKALL